jgi:transcriptional regulator with XRE-family HTH domain
VAEPKFDQFYREFGRRVRSVRENAGITQAQLASAIGLTRSSVANLEAGRQKVLLHVLIVMAELLQVEPSELLPSDSGRPLLDLAQLDRQLRELPSDHRDFVMKAIRVGIGGSVNDGAS